MGPSNLTDLTPGTVVEDRFNIILFFTFVVLSVPHAIKPITFHNSMTYVFPI